MAIVLTAKGAFTIDKAFGGGTTTITSAALGTGDIIVNIFSDFAGVNSVTVGTSSSPVTANLIGVSTSGNSNAWLATGVNTATGVINIGTALNILGANWWLITGENTSPTLTSAAANSVSGTVPSGGEGVFFANDYTLAGNPNPAVWTGSGVTGSTTEESYVGTGQQLAISGAFTTNTGSITATASNYTGTAETLMLAFSATGASGGPGNPFGGNLTLMGFG